MDSKKLSNQGFISPTSKGNILTGVIYIELRP